ncbi:capsid protein [Clostridium gasigenes]|uniref:capsid protein n=1 Tax=Clostridium gasigenes TaxID=94869 RepID=UPI001A9B4386|nr:capsid protein [Clostridium gasigenes]
MAVNYATQYSKALANAYPYSLYTGKLWTTENSSKYNIVDAKTIQIPLVSVTGRTDGNRDKIDGFKQNHSNSYETKTLGHHRSWETFIHPKDISETNKVLSIQNITQTMNETQKFPEMDAYIISTLYALKNAKETIVQETADLTAASILAKFDKLMDEMDEALVPPSGRLLYVDTYTKTMIDNAISIVRSNGDKTIARAINRIEEVEILSMPTTLLKTEYDFTVGWVPKSTAKSIAMMLVHPSVILPIVSYEFALLGEPSTLSKGKYTYFEESFEDVFILNEKHNALKFVVKK